VGSNEPPRVLEVHVPEPGPGQVKINIACSAVNQADLKVSSGQFVGRLLHARVSPLIVGYDFSGRVDGGPGMGDLRTGDEVFGFLPYASATRQGAFAEFVVVDRGTIARKPQSVSHETAAAAATVGLTALQFLRDLGRLKAGGKVLITGAAGGVGSLAVGIAKRLGAHVTAVCSSYAVEHVRGLGADVIVDRRQQDPFGVEGPFDVIFDPAAAYSYFAFSRRIAACGAFVSTVPSPLLFLGKAIAPLSGKRCDFGSVKPVSADLEQLAAWLQSGLQVPIAARFSAKDLGGALAQVAKGELLGRVVVQVDGGF
jgi:NADPH:quinone reductase-like Zn-dependent oxidoreductase